MTDRSVIFIDAGYLFATAGRRVCDTALRSALSVDNRSLVDGILQHVGDSSQVSNLRIYWYDATKYGRPTEEHKELAMIPGVKLRLGRIGTQGEQKGVDIKLGLDLVSVARNRAASVAYLVSGDDDMTEAVEQAQELGMQVVLLGIPSEEGLLGVDSVSENLALIVDHVESLSSSLLEETFEETERSADATIRYQRSRYYPRSHPLRSLGTPSAPSYVGPPTHSYQEEVEEGYQEAEGESHRSQNEEIIEIVREVAERTAIAWITTSTGDKISELFESRPQIPAEIDRVLLTDAARKLNINDLDPHIRVWLRNYFWEMIDNIESGSGDPSIT